MIKSNDKIIKDNYIKDFPEIELSKKVLYVHYEIISKFNRNNIITSSLNNFKNSDKIILDCGTEAIHFNDIKFLIETLKKYEFSNILLVNSGLNDNFDFKSIYIPNFIQKTDNEVIPLKDRKILYISLSRLIISKFQRLLLTYELFKNDLLKDGIVTCGCNFEEIKTIKEYSGIVLFPEDFQRIIPLCYDGIAEKVSSSNKYMTIGKECLINIVQESSFDIIKSEEYPIMYFNGGYGWNRPFFTEKTAKCFNSCQLPLFLSVKGYVSLLKSMGFDVFDDIIDHSYDNEENPDKRIKLIVKELIRLKNIGLDKLKNIEGLEERLFYNKNYMETIHQNMFKRYTSYINSWFFNDI